MKSFNIILTYTNGTCHSITNFRAMNKYQAYIKIINREMSVIEDIVNVNIVEAVREN